MKPTNCFSVRKALLPPALCLTVFAGQSALAQDTALLDERIACHPTKDSCGRLTKRQRDIGLAVCETFMRRGSAEVKLSVTKKLKGKTCTQLYGSLKVVDE